jgi:predicted  nucleic acid-binding Zn-ribbon protein
MPGTEPLLALQENDSAIDRLSARRRTLEAGETVVVARAEADAAERALGELGLQVDVMSRDQRRFEHEIDSISQKVSSEEKRLFDGSIANAKELEAIQHELDNLKKRRSDREDELLALLEQREELDERATEAGKVASHSRREVEETVAAADEELVQVVGELKAHIAAREEIVPLLDPDLVELYEDLRKTKKGVGAAALIDGVCQGCHEQLSASELDRMKRSDGVKRCDHCRRILVF